MMVVNEFNHPLRPYFLVVGARRFPSTQTLICAMVKVVAILRMVIPPLIGILIMGI